MGDMPGRHWLGKARGLVPPVLLALACVFALLGAAPAPTPSASAAAAGTVDAPVANTAAATADDLPRHELETLALVDPGKVLRLVPDALEKAKAAGDWREQALLQLARANACRVLA